jgi:hypothetical protein
VSGLDGCEDGRTGRVREFIFRAVTHPAAPSVQKFTWRAVTDDSLTFQLPTWAAPQSPCLGELIARRDPHKESVAMPRALLPTNGTLSIDQSDRFVRTAERDVLGGIRDALCSAKNAATLNAETAGNFVNLHATSSYGKSQYFDTNVFGNVQRALISRTDWRYLLSHSPGRGWPLSQVTALELLVGIHVAKPADFPNVRQRIELAYHLSNGRVLNDPRFLLCKEVLRIPFPADQLPPSASVISKYMDVVRRASTLDQLLRGRVPYKGKVIGISSTSILADLMAGPKRAWAAQVEATADERYPAWRDLFQKTSRRLPLGMRRELEPLSAWEALHPALAKALLDWLGATTDPVLVAQLSTRLDAVFDFTIFVAREFLLRNYSLEKHQSDIFDQFQLQYLAMDRFVIVTADPDLSTRTRKSSQAARIMSFDRFLRTL